METSNLLEINLKTRLEAISEARKRKIPTLPNGAENIANMIIKLSQGPVGSTALRPN